MQLTKLFISGFKSISNEHPQTINLEHEITAFIGHNGTGKSAVLEALNKLFSIDHSLRGLSLADFHATENDKNEPKELVIEACFCFPKDDNNPVAIPHLIDSLTIADDGGDLIFRVRLEASLSFDFSPMGDIEENIWVIATDEEVPNEDDKIRLTAAVRNAIQVNYVPANRDPLAQLKYSSRAILGRLLKSIKWNEDTQSDFEVKAEALNQLTIDNPALKEITASINNSWQTIYKGRYLSEAILNFPLGNIDEMLRLLQLQFNPDENGSSIDTSRLSDGQKSLVYFALTKALFDIDKVTRKAVFLGEETNFDPDKMKLPIFSLIALEEPENHLSPHYLGRIVNLIKEYGQSELCQSIVSTHSSSIVGRIEPKQIRHFRLDYQHESTSISSLTLPKEADEQAKFISEAVKAYPEIYFAKMVILGEGDSEQVIIPKILEHFSTDLDSHSISVVPLGGRHVNHFWRLLDSLKIPYITLLDFDIDRNGGGFGRVKYAIEQLSNYKAVNYLHKDMLNCIPNWDDPRSPADFTVSFKNKDETTSIINLKDELENNNVFFSSPLDIDYSMIECFPEVFCTPDKAYGERGPIEGKEDEEEKIAGSRELALLKAVLKKGNSGVRYNFTGDYLNNFLWYRYRFLSNKSKPASHVRMFSKLEENYPSAEIVKKLPPELIRLATKVSTIIDEIVE